MGEASEPVIRIFGILDVTGEVIAMWVFLVLAAVISILVTRNLKDRPGKLQNLLEIAVESDISLLEAHRIAERVHSAVEKQFPNVKHVMIHVNPKDEQQENQ